MPVYASTSRFGDHRRHPSALLFIVGGHAALIAAVMAAKMTIPPRVPDPPIMIDSIKVPDDPPPVDPPQPQEQNQAPQSTPYRPPIDVPISPFDNPPIATGTVPTPPTDPVVGTNPGLPVGPITVAGPVRIAASPITPDRLLRPPYPADKQRLDEEGSLRLKLFIDERGRVTAVEPVGKVDRSFFESARRHLIANWRYKPATEDGRPVASSMVITLTFRLA